MVESWSHFTSSAGLSPVSPKYGLVPCDEVVFLRCARNVHMHRNSDVYVRPEFLGKEMVQSFEVVGKKFLLNILPIVLLMGQY